MKSVTAYRVIGWHRRIPDRDKTVANLSDGAIFSTESLAKDYACKYGISLLRIDPITLPADDPQIDFHIQPVAEMMRRLGMSR